MLKLLAELLVPLATVFFSINLLLGRRCVAHTPKAQPVSGVGILSENDRPVVLETAGAVSGTTETMEMYLAQKGMLLRYSVTDLALICVRTNLSLGRTTKEVMVRALLSEFEFDSVQLNLKDDVTTLQAVQCGLLATASRKP